MDPDRLKFLRNFLDRMTTRKDAMSEYIADIIFDIDDAKYMPSHLTEHGQAWLMSDQDYNEYNYNRDVDSYADDADALCSVFGGEE